MKSYQPYHNRIQLGCSPVALFETLYRDEPWGFLYESLESREKRGRYSFIGAKPFLRFQSKGRFARIEQNGAQESFACDPFDALKQLVYDGIRPPDVFPFSGGAVGTVAYDTVRLIENLPCVRRDDSSVPDMDFVFPSELVVFDHLENVMDIIVYSERNGNGRIRQILQQMKTIPSEEPEFPRTNRVVQAEIHSRFRRDDKSDSPPLAAYKNEYRLGYSAACSRVVHSNFSKESFCRAVEKAKAYILSGDIFQVVLSQQMTFSYRENPLETYKNLRLTNPSPYMYYIRSNERHVLGSSPEILVKLAGTKVSIRPLAGTRPRGRTEEEDMAMEAQLVQDEKERAEHAMLVDLARNDIGRVCEYGSVQATGLFEVERYSKVMHLVSNVEGRLRSDKNAFDLIKACFPAGTVSGAPKVRAMEIIHELEPDPRGLYAGSIGYFGFSGDMDMCIAIRMLTMQNGMGMVQAGAGIVADSDPEKEYQESLNKARAVLAAAGVTGG